MSLGLLPKLRRQLDDKTSLRRAQKVVPQRSQNAFIHARTTTSITSLKSTTASVRSTTTTTSLQQHPRHVHAKQRRGLNTYIKRSSKYSRNRRRNVDDNIKRTLTAHLSAHIIGIVDIVGLIGLFSGRCYRQHRSGAAHSNRLRQVAADILLSLE